MNAKTITSALIVAVLGFTLGMPGSALADRDDRGHRHGHSQHDGHKYRQHRRDHKHHKRHDKHRKHHAKRHYKHHKKHHHGRHGHGGYRNYYYYEKDDDDDHEKLLIGLVIGGILGYALNEHQQGSVEQYGDYYHRNAYQPNSGSSCLQQREYQTTVIVGGRPVDAYGTACLQPDGSWTRSPAQVAAY